MVAVEASGFSVTVARATATLTTSKSGAPTASRSASHHLVMPGIGTVFESPRQPSRKTPSPLASAKATGATASTT